MKATGILRKMETRLSTETADERALAEYTLKTGTSEWAVNRSVGKHVRLVFMDEIHCLHCGRKTKKSYGQGYCYPCFISIPETDACVLRPELCQAHLGISRDMSWSEEHCLQDHYVYLALSGGVKVGVTRHSQVPVRWIDQGAHQAVILAKTPNRHLAGEIEVALKKHMSDKTNWRLMLTRDMPEDTDLVSLKHSVRSLIPEELRHYYFEDDHVTKIRYPVLRFPEKVSGVNFDKQREIEGVLTGIRGQYLIFDGGRVFNVRRHGGYLTEIDADE